MQTIVSTNFTAAPDSHVARTKVKSSGWFRLAELSLSHRLSNDVVTQVIWLLFRFYVGITISVGAGFSKLPVPGWFVKQVGEIGFSWPSPAFWTYIAVWGEAFGGLMLAFGLLTRLNALQLAFQFFVVSFIWYSEPEFFGMYYQQLIFWGFVLVLGLGGGRFSLDAVILKYLKARQ